MGASTASTFVLEQSAESSGLLILETPLPEEKNSLGEEERRRKKQREEERDHPILLM